MKMQQQQHSMPQQLHGHRESIRKKVQDGFIGPNGSTDPDDLKLIEEALRSLDFVNMRVMDKRDARLCLVNEISK